MISFPEPSLVVLVGATGNQLPFSPRWQWSGGASWLVPVDVGGTLRLGANATYQTSYYSDVFNYAQGRIAPQSFVDANLTYSPSGKHWSLAVIARNLADHRRYQSITWGGTPNLWYGPVSPPRTLFFKVGYTL